MDPVLLVLDEDRNAVALDDDESAMLFLLTSNLDPATVSSCPSCRSRVLATVAFGDLVRNGPYMSSGAELMALADEAPTLHLYLIDVANRCDHRRWRDPGAEEWFNVAGPFGGQVGQH